MNMFGARIKMLWEEQLVNPQIHYHFIIIIWLNSVYIFNILKLTKSQLLASAIKQFSGQNLENDKLALTLIKSF